MKKQKAYNKRVFNTRTEIYILNDECRYFMRINNFQSVLTYSVKDKYIAELYLVILQI